MGKCCSKTNTGTPKHQIYEEQEKKKKETFKTDQPSNVPEFSEKPVTEPKKPTETIQTQVVCFETPKNQDHEPNSQEKGQEKPIKENSLERERNLCEESNPKIAPFNFEYFKGLWLCPAQEEEED